MAPMEVITDITLGVPALLTNDYCPDVHERLSLYKRLASVESQDKLVEIREELVDRFGDLPEQAQSLFETHRLRLSMARLGIKKIDAHPAQITIQFIPNPPIDPIKIIQLVQTNKRVQLNGQDKLKILPADKESFIGLTQRLEAIRQLFKHLGDTIVKDSL